MPSGATSSDSGRTPITRLVRPLAATPCESGTSTPPNDAAPFVTGDRAEVHRGRADEAGDEHVRRPFVQLPRRPALLQVSVLQHGDAMAERHRLGLVVRHVDGRDRRSRTGERRCPRASARGASRRGSTAARPSGRRWARGRSPGPSRRAGAVRRKAGPACARGTPSRPSSFATSLTRFSRSAFRTFAISQREADVRGDGEIRVERVVLEHHRDVAVLRRDRSVTSRSPMKIAPASTSSRPASMRSAVVLPEPEGPTSTMNSPSCDVQVERVDGGRVRAGIDRASPGRSERQPTVATPRPAAKRTTEPRRCARRACASASAPSSSSPSSAAPTIGGEAVGRTVELRRRLRAGRARSARAGRRPRPAARRRRAAPRPAPRVRSSRVSATRASATTSAASRWTISAATASSAASASTSGASSVTRRCSDLPEWIASASSLGVVEAEVSRNGSLEARPRPASVFAPRRGRDGGEAEVVAAAPVAGDRAERGEPRMPAVRGDADAVDPGAAVIATPQPRSVPARRTANVSLPTMERVAPSRAARRRRAQRPPPRGSRRRPAAGGDVRDPAVVVAEPRLARRVVEQPLEHGEAAFDAEVMGRAQRTANEREHRAVGADEREVGLRVAAVDGEHDRARSSLDLRVGTAADARRRLRAGGRRAPRTARAGRSAGASAAPCARLPGRRSWPPARRAARTRRRVASGRAAPARPAAAAAASARPRPIRAGTSTTSSSARPAIVPSLRTSTTWTLAVVRGERADQSDRRLAVEGAATLLEQRRLLVQRSGRGTARAAHARSRRPSPRAGRRRAAPRAPRRARRSSAGSRRERRRARPAERRGSPSSRELVAVRRPAEPASTSSPSTRTDRTQDRWFRPDLIDRRSRSGSTPSSRAKRPLVADRDVAETDGAVAVVEQRPGDDPDRIREVDDPGAVGSALAHAVGDLEHDRNRAQRLAETARRRSSPARCSRTRAARSRPKARLLPADPDLDQDEVGAVDRAVEIVGDLEPPV